MESIDVLFGRDRCNGVVGIQMRRQRKLDKNAVDGLISVQRGDQIEKPGPADIGRAGDVQRNGSRVPAPV